MTCWTLRIEQIRFRSDGVRWTVACRTADEAVLAWADTTTRGTLLGLHTNGCIGSTGDEHLDRQIAVKIADTLAERRVAQTLDEFGRRRRGRSDRLRWAA